MGLRIQQIACGPYHALALLSDGSLWAAGRNQFGPLGDGTQDNRFGWVCVIPSGAGVVQVATGEYHSLALKSDGAVWATGNNYYGQLGDGTSKDKKSWTCVLPAGSDVAQVFAGGDHSLVLKWDGSVWATGNNKYGQLGDGTNDNQYKWIPVMVSGVTQVAAGSDHSLILKSDGSLWATGYNLYGQLGNSKSTYNTSSWNSVIPSGVTQVAAGPLHSLALKSDGSVWATGHNYYGQSDQLEDGATTNKTIWTSVMASGVTQVVAGSGHSLALKSDGSVWATGYNEYGQLGDGTKTQSHSWKSVIPFGATQVAVGSAYSLALKSDGTLWKTGNNNCGQLGYEGSGSTIWIPDHFFERLLLDSLLSEPGSLPDRMPESTDDWQGLSL
jgi:alpha-tubulin suppressor-like RCC1 family protein